MKPPTYTEMIMLRSGIELARGLSQRDKAILLNLLAPEMARLRQACRYSLSIPGLGPGPWYFKTKAEGETRRRWLIKNIDLNPKVRVIPYIP